MPPSDDPLELMTATSSEGSTSSSLPSNLTLRATATEHGQQPSLSPSSSLRPAISLTIQDQLSNVFETKMKATTTETEVENTLEDMIATDGSSSSSSGMSNSIEVTSSGQLQQQQAVTPVTTSLSPHLLSEQGVESSKISKTEGSTEFPANTFDSQENEMDTTREETTQSPLEEAIAETTTTTTTTDSNLSCDDGESNKNEQSDNYEKESGREQENDKVVRDGPLAMLRKGAVAAVGGTMVGVGLVMIPLPTPFGAVIASSGLAVLGTEFKEAKQMNERLIEGAKSTVSGARDRLVKSIESMEIDDFDADVDSRQGNATTTTTSNDEKCDSKTLEGRNTSGIIAVPLVPPNKAEVAGDENEGEKDTPKWLHMNPIEQQRQERLAKEKYRRENQTAFEQTKEYFTKKTGSFLSRNLLPLLKEKKEEEKKDVKTDKSEKVEARIQEDEEYVLVGSETTNDKGDAVIHPENSIS
ncbi:putative transmembrane protein PGPGW [Nitzschia inconspicua]|uniref:Transmembrane protein PGPGW n=1 Tax=Nitzschia inconspicua TaxID=303405 RepID=A0A9K3LCG3_9STRA|nr:putative transmembrane protein PGPGW [Nitzschia inconspicua]